MSDYRRAIEQLDNVVHHRARLGILAVLRDCDRASFAHVKSILGLSDGNLASHLRTLLAHHCVEINKSGRTTWISITPTGRSAFDLEIAALQLLIE